MSLILGIDLGTQSLKVLIYCTQQRQVLASASAPLTMVTRSNGSAEQQADHWLSALHIAMHQLDPALRHQLAAVGVSGQQHGLVMIDAESQVLAPVKLWCDTSTLRECEEIMAAIGGREATIWQVGNAIVPGYTAPKILYFKKNYPAIYQACRHILLPHDYLNHVLTGAIVMEAGDASGTGLLDIRRRCWSEVAVSAIDKNLAEKLPQIVPHDHIIGHITSSIAQQLGIPAGIPVAPGGGDNMMGAIGTANVQPGAFTVSLGTSGTVFACTDAPIIDPAGEIAAFCSSTGNWLPLFCMMNCTVATEIMRQLLSATHEDIQYAIDNTHPGADGLVLLPYFNGERVPNFPEARGSLLGITLTNLTQKNLLRATMEGVCFGLNYGIEKLKALKVNADHIYITGGGANNQAWRQMLADITQMPIQGFVQQEGAALGAALSAAWLIEQASSSLSDYISLHLLLDESQTTLPDESRHAAYQTAYLHHQHVIEKTRSLYPL